MANGSEYQEAAEHANTAGDQCLSPSKVLDNVQSWESTTKVYLAKVVSGLHPE